MTTKLKLVKWPVEESAEIVAKVKKIEWPDSVRSYVKGLSTCVGLTSGPNGTKVFMQKRDFPNSLEEIQIHFKKFKV